MASLVGWSSIPQTILVVGREYSQLAAKANDLAASALCPNGPPACGKCAVCGSVRDGTSQDIHILNAWAHEVSKDAVAELKRMMSVSSQTGGRRVMVIYGLERLSLAAKNSLLKFLEEPSPSLWTVMTASNRDQVTPTIASRAAIVDVAPDRDAFTRAVGKVKVEKRVRDVMANCYDDAVLAQTLLGTERLEAVVAACDTLDEYKKGKMPRLKVMEAIAKADYRSIGDVCAYAVRRYGAGERVASLIDVMALSPFRAVVADRLADALAE